ncbi:uncharacterized protein METZ01_LOCUS386541, partial [marine metagenome]
IEILNNVMLSRREREGKPLSITLD